MMNPQFVGDLSQLPTHAHGNRSLTWWGMMGMIAIESTAFILGAAAYLYLMNQVKVWPPAQKPPTLLYGTLFTMLVALSMIPNLWLKKQAEKENLRAVQLGLVIMLVIGLALIVVRFYEFTVLNTHWTSNAYGSILWTMLGLHTVHLITDFGDSVVLTVLMFTRHARGRRFVDVAENAVYWNFVVYAWLPIYVLLYWVPRWR